MEFRHQHKNERDVSAEKDRKEQDVETRPQWPGKRTLTSTDAHVDTRSPDLKRIRSALATLRTGGAPLPGAMTAEYSKLLGLDLSDVRLHRGGAAGAAAKTLEATAFTHGTDIAIADHLDLDSAFGRHVIAHELVHVAQNKRSGAPMDLAAHMEIGPSGSAIEAEAERGAAALTRGMSFTVSAHSKLPGISRFGHDEAPPTGAAVPVPVPGANPPPVPAAPQAAVPTPTSQPTQAQPAATPPPPPPNPQAAPAPQPRPTNQPSPTATPNAPGTPQVGTPGHNAPSGSGAAPNPTTPANREPRPAATPAPSPGATPALSLDARVQQELEQRADPTLKTGYARAVAGVDALRVQALQFSFTPNGVWNTLVETFTAKNAFQDHFGQIYSANAYRGGNSWADTAQTWIEGLRGVVHIIGDIASVISAWAGLAALVTGALALILSETVIGGIALGAIAAIAAQIALVAGAVKLLTDIIDTLLGIIQMIILIVRARNSKDPAQRARFAQLLRKEANDFGANVISIGVQVAVMAVSAGIGAGLSRGANSFMSAFKTEFSKMISPALKPWTLGANIRGIAAMARPVAPGAGVARGRTILAVEVSDNLIGLSRLQRNALGRVTSTREIVPFTAANQMRGARLVTMRAAVGRAMAINGAGVKIGLGAGQIQADVKQPRDGRGGLLGLQGVGSSSPSANGGRISAPSSAGADLTRLQMWPSQIEAFENAKGPIQGTVDRTQRQYEMAEAQAGPELSAQVRTAFQGANNSAGQVRFGAMQVQTDATEGQATTQRGLQQTTQARQGQDRMGATQTDANRSVQRIQGEGSKLQSPPPKEGVLGWLYNQTIGRIGGWIGSAQRWVTNLVGKWAMSLAGFSKDEMDIAGIENDMRDDATKDQNSTTDAQEAAVRADAIQQTVFQLQENKTRDEQYAIQGMADAQRFIQALEDADRQLAAAITNGQAYIGQVTPIIQHELQTEENNSAIDEAYVAPVIAAASAFNDSLDGSNVGSRAQQQGTERLNQMKAAYPDLDISPATSAVAGSVGSYNTAFGSLVSSAQGQAATVQTAVRAFIGTQDYDGVNANAAALDALAADFDRAAQGLADQLYAGINGTINQVNAHIQRAVDEANAIVDDPDAAVDAPPAADPVAPAPVPSAAPTPVQRKSIPNASTPTIAVQRKALTNDKPPQQMQQTASADQPPAVPTDINNPPPTAQAAPAPAGDNANAPQPAEATSAEAAAGAQVPGAAPNGATSSTPKDGLVGGASNTAEAPDAAGKAKNATPKQASKPGGPEKAESDTANEGDQAIAAASAGSGAGSNGSDNASAPGPSSAPAAKKSSSDQPATEAAPSSGAAAPAAKNKKEATKAEKDKGATPEASAGGGGGGGGGEEAASAPMMSGGAIEDGWSDADRKKTDDDGVDAEVAVQRKASGESAGSSAMSSSPVAVATAATAGSGGSLPYLGAIQESFGHHDVSGIRAHSGGAAQEGAAALGASAFAVGDAVAFASSPDLHTAAHEAAHVVQQRAGLRPSGDIDSGPMDSLEQHADVVADAVVAGRSAQSLLDQLVGGMASGAGSIGGVQRKEAPAATKTPTLTSATVATVEGSEATRTTVGVGETVDLTSTSAGTWTATAGTAAGSENTKFQWTAPGKPGAAIVRVKTSDGEASKEFAVVGPSKMTFVNVGAMAPARDDMMGAGMQLDMIVGTKTDNKVSFGGITIREQPGGASNTSGYFASVSKSGKEDLFHYPQGKGNAPKQTTISGSNRANATDEASILDDETQPWARPFSVGSMTWQIPYLYSCGEVTDQPFTLVSQTMSIVDSKVTVTVTKGSVSHSRAPKQPVWQPPKNTTKKTSGQKSATGRIGGFHADAGTTVTTNTSPMPATVAHATAEKPTANGNISEPPSRGNGPEIDKGTEPAVDGTQKADGAAKPDKAVAKPDKDPGKADKDPGKAKPETAAAGASPEKGASPATPTGGGAPAQGGKPGADVAGMKPEQGLAALQGKPVDQLGKGLGQVYSATSAETAKERADQAANPPKQMSNGEAAAKAKPKKDAAKDAPQEAPKDAAKDPAAKDAAKAPINGVDPNAQAAKDAKQGAATQQQTSAQQMVATIAQSIGSWFGSWSSLFGGGKGKDKMSEAESQNIAGSVDKISTNVASPPADPNNPKVAEKAKADTSAQRDRAALESKTAAAQKQGLADASVPMGEDSISTSVMTEELSAKIAEASNVPPPAVLPTLASQGASEEVGIIARQDHGAEIDAALAKASADVSVERTKHAEAETAARAEADASLKQIKAQSDAEQTQARAKAKADVEGARTQWKAEVEKKGADVRAQADKKVAEGMAQIDAEETKANTEAQRHIAEGQQKAAEEQQKGEREAEAAKERGKSESSGFFGWLARKAKAAFEGIKRAVSAAIDAARAAVKAVIDGAKKLAMAAIDLARKAITAAIKLIGDALTALSEIMLAAFPELKAKFQAAIKSAVDAATQIVDQLAEGLKTAVAAALDVLGAAIDAALKLYETAINLVIDAAAVIVDTAIKAAQVVADGLAIWAGLIKDIATGPIEWIAKLGAAAIDGVTNHLWSALKVAVVEWFSSKVFEILGVGGSILQLLFDGGMSQADIVDMALQGLMSAIPMALTAILIEQVIAMIIPAAGAVMAVIRGLQAAWGTISRIFAAFGAFIAFLQMVNSGQAGPHFAQLIALSAVVVLDFVSNYLLRKLMGPAKKIGEKLKGIAAKLTGKGKGKAPKAPKAGSKKRASSDSPGDAKAAKPKQRKADANKDKDPKNKNKEKDQNKEKEKDNRAAKREATAAAKRAWGAVKGSRKVLSQSEVEGLISRSSKSSGKVQVQAKLNQNGQTWNVHAEATAGKTSAKASANAGRGSSLKAKAGGTFFAPMNLSPIHKQIVRETASELKKHSGEKPKDVKAAYDAKKALADRLEKQGQSKIDSKIHGIKFDITMEPLAQVQTDHKIKTTVLISPNYEELTLEVPADADVFAELVKRLEPITKQTFHNPDALLGKIGPIAKDLGVRWDTKGGEEGGNIALTFFVPDPGKQDKKHECTIVSKNADATKCANCGTTIPTKGDGQTGPHLITANRLWRDAVDTALQATITFTGLSAAISGSHLRDKLGENFSKHAQQKRAGQKQCPDCEMPHTIASGTTAGPGTLRASSSLIQRRASEAAKLDDRVAGNQLGGRKLTDGDAEAITVTQVERIIRKVNVESMLRGFTGDQLHPVMSATGAVAFFLTQLRMAVLSGAR